MATDQISSITPRQPTKPVKRNPEPRQSVAQSHTIASKAEAPKAQRTSAPMPRVAAAPRSSSSSPMPRPVAQRAAQRAYRAPAVGEPGGKLRQMQKAMTHRTAVRTRMVDKVDFPQNIAEPAGPSLGSLVGKGTRLSTKADVVRGVDRLLGKEIYINNRKIGGRSVDQPDLDFRTTQLGPVSGRFPIPSKFGRAFVKQR